MLYQKSLIRRIKAESPVKLFFRKPPVPGAKRTGGSKDKDNIYWGAIMMPEEIDGLPHDGNFVIKVRRPTDSSKPSWAICGKKITSFATFAEGKGH